jgi:hypothetical protein
MSIIVYTKETASGGREGWARTVKSVDDQLTGVKAFTGEYLKQGQQQIESGTLVLEICHCGSAKNGYPYPVFHRATDAGLVCVWDNDEHTSWTTEFETIRAKAQELLNIVVNPFEAYSSDELIAELKRRGDL